MCVQWGWCQFLPVAPMALATATRGTFPVVRLLSRVMSRAMMRWRSEGRGREDIRDVWEGDASEPKKLKTENTPSGMFYAASVTASGVGETQADDGTTPRQRMVSLARLQFDGTTSRFYHRADVAPHDTGWAVTLDGSLVRTTKKRDLVAPTYALALALAAEWESQGDNIWPFSMPLHKIAVSAIDLLPDNTAYRSMITRNILRTVDGDALRFRASDPVLCARQHRRFTPLLVWVKETYGVDLPLINDMTVDKSEDLIDPLREVVNAMDDWTLAAVEYMVNACNSLLLSLAVSNNRITVEEAAKYVDLDRDYQIEDWGLVEAVHDVDTASLRAKIGAGVTTIRLLHLDPLQAMCPQ